jgi:hypothetical protein
MPLFSEEASAPWPFECWKGRRYFEFFISGSFIYLQRCRCGARVDRGWHCNICDFLLTKLKIKTHKDNESTAKIAGIKRKFDV